MTLLTSSQWRDGAGEGSLSSKAQSSKPQSSTTQSSKAQSSKAQSLSARSASAQETRSHGSQTPERVFYQLLEAIAAALPQHHAFSASLAGEDSQFIRFSQAKVRQTGQVKDAHLRLTVMSPQQSASAQIPFVGHFETDWEETQLALRQLLKDLPELPADPYLVLPSPSEQGVSREVQTGSLLPPEAVSQTLLSAVHSFDFAGFYGAGLCYRAYGDSTGKRHWFETPSFTLDYSLFGAQAHQAVKGTLAGSHWNMADYHQAIAAGCEQLALMARPVKTLPKGDYRTYLAPSAVAELLDTIIYGGLGEAALRQGHSAFGKLEQGEAILSEQFSLREDFSLMGIPRFNHRGIVAPGQLPIIHEGQWATALVNERSAKEYGKPSNGANASESMRAPVVAPGSLAADQVLDQLDTGLYLSNLHYLNWSDLTAGRITGMTRYACFWVEAGEIVAPIENLRFDDNLYRFLGEGLLALGNRPVFSPTVDTYERRSLGGLWAPGMLIEQFRYTL